MSGCLGTMGVARVDTAVGKWKTSVAGPLWKMLAAWHSRQQLQESGSWFIPKPGFEPSLAP